MQRALFATSFRRRTRSFPPGWGLACAGHSLLGLGGRPRDFLAAPVLCLAQGEHVRRLKPEAIPVQLGLADEHVVAVLRVDDLDQRAIHPRQVTAQRGLASGDLGHVVPFARTRPAGRESLVAHRLRAYANSAWARCLLSVCAADQNSRSTFAEPAVMRTCLPAAVSTCSCLWFRQRTPAQLWTVPGPGKADHGWPFEQRRRRLLRPAAWTPPASCVPPTRLPSERSPRTSGAAPGARALTRA